MAAPKPAPAVAAQPATEPPQQQQQQPEEEKQDWKLEVLDKVWLYRCPDTRVDKAALLQGALQLCFDHDLSGVYAHACAEAGVPVDQARLGAMRAANAARVAGLEAEAKEAEESAGESEVRDALLAKAEYLARIGDKEGAAAAFATAEAKSAGSGPKMDIAFSQVRWAWFGCVARARACVRMGANARNS